MKKKIITLITLGTAALTFPSCESPEEKAKRLGQHNPKIEFNEAVLPIGAAIYAQAAKDWLEENLNP